MSSVPIGIALSGNAGHAVAGNADRHAVASGARSGDLSAVLSPANVYPLNCLSAREIQVLKLVVEGRTSKQIARELGVLPSTVDTYRSRLMSKLGVGDVPALVRLAIRHGLISL